MMIKRYILTSLLTAATAAAFSLGSAANVYAENGVRAEQNSKDRLRATFFRVESENNGNKQVVQVVPNNNTVVPNNNNTNGNHASVPEPATMLLIGSALGGLALLRGRKEMD